MYICIGQMWSERSGDRRRVIITDFNTVVSLMEQRRRWHYRIVSNSI